MNYDALKTELTEDPLALGYSGMTDQEVADSLNAVNRQRNRTSMTGSEVINAVDPTQWAGLADAQRQTVWNVVHLGTVDPFGVEATLLTDVFGAESATITALAAMRKQSISRATELGYPVLRPYDIQRART